MSEHETKPSDETATVVVEVEILENEEFINRALTKFDASEEFLLRIEAEAKAITIAGIEDKEGYKAADRLRKDIKQVRLAMDAKEKELIELPKKFINAVKAYALPRRNRMKFAETAIQEKTDAIDKLQAEADRIEAERRQLQFVERTDKLITLGLKFNGSVYALGTCILLPSQIQNADNAAWTAMLAQAEAAAAEERDRIEREQAKERELEELRKKLAEQQQPAATEKPSEPTETVNGTPRVGVIGAGPGKTVAASMAAAGMASTEVKMPPPAAVPTPAPTITHPTNPGAANIATDPADDPTAPQSPELPSAKAWKALNIPQSPNTGHMKAGFAKGWDAALNSVLEVLNNPEIKTRGDIKQAISNLKIKA